MVKQLTTQVRTKKRRKEEKQEERKKRYSFLAVSSSFISIELQKTALGTKYQGQKTLTKAWRA
jgi:hypothetical protein